MRRRTDGETLAQVEARERFAVALNAFDLFDVIAEFRECGATEVAGFGAEFRGARFDRGFFQVLVELRGESLAGLVAAGVEKVEVIGRDEDGKGSNFSGAIRYPTGAGRDTGVERVGV